MDCHKRRVTLIHAQQIFYPELRGKEMMSNRGMKTLSIEDSGNPAFNLLIDRRKT
jgi:hypothetical protein